MQCDDMALLFRSARSGSRDAAGSLLSAVYDDLRHVAVGLFSRERRDHTLQPTALVHEAWLKLAPSLDQVEDRVHFLAVASRAMRRVLIDHGRRRRRQKREGKWRRVTLNDQRSGASGEAVDIVDLCDLLDRLSALNKRHAEIVELRILGGLTISEVATVLGLAQSTIEDDWFTAKAWFRVELDRP